MTERAEKDSGGSAAETDKAASPTMAATKRSAVMGAMFLMATSAIGPGFLTQTSAFTAQLGAALAFAIGGPDGLDHRLREEAALVVAFGALTLPHQLVRVLVAEQLYRALSILSGHPYHRGE